MGIMLRIIAGLIVCAAIGLGIVRILTGPGSSRAIAFLEMYQGRFAEAVPWLERAWEVSRIPGVPAKDRASVRALLGLVALRRGEVENCLGCLGPSSCIFPIAREAVHLQQAGS